MLLRCRIRVCIPCVREDAGASPKDVMFVVFPVGDAEAYGMCVVGCCAGLVRLRFWDG